MRLATLLRSGVDRLALCAILPLSIVFSAPGFPVRGLVDDQPIPIPAGLEDPFVAEDTDRLVEALKTARAPGDVLVWRHGSTFPAAAWPALIGFLEGGGALVHLGGEPFTHPVIRPARPATGPSDMWVVQPRTLAMLEALRLKPSGPVDVGGAWLVDPDDVERPMSDPLPEGTRVTVLQPRFSSEPRLATEDGSPGEREAVLTPLSWVRGTQHPRPVAAASYVIGHRSGRFAGGRWVLHLADRAPAPAELERLLAAAEPAREVHVAPTYGCFHEGEQPTLSLTTTALPQAPRPGSADETDPPSAFTVTVEGPDGVARPAVQASAVPGVPTAIALEGAHPPGLYRVLVESEHGERATTGFWIRDEALFRSGGPLGVDEFTLWRGGESFPVVGTTTMSRTVHRDFLFEPDALVWDETFAELAALDINLVRTGVWAGFADFVSDAGEVDEAWLRALEAYYLSARRHDIPILFTFFAFVPHAFGGVSPYFDPTSREAQKSYLRTVAERFAHAPEMFWDLINEPSFAAPDKLWLCRPNGDLYERATFRSWLSGRHGDGDDWEDLVRARWRLAPGEEIDVPRDDDFVDSQVFDGRHPYRARDYLRFAQDAFEAWALDMRHALREGGSYAPVTVGQDEGGLVDRPHPLFHGRSLDFQSIHTWWFNDALLWDGLMSRLPGKALLVSETGIMERELLSREPLRGDEEKAALLSRKIGHAFGSGAFGLVEWCYEVNPYMASDNEIAIGARRVDGSYKPEHEVLVTFARFFARNRERFVPRPGVAPANVVLLLPWSDLVSPRGLALRSSQEALRVLVEELGLDVRVVPEHRTAGALDGAALIVLPSTRGLDQRSWEHILEAVEDGATLACSGWFEQDDAGLPAERLGVARRPLAIVESMTGRGADVRFDLDVVQSAFAATHSASAPRGAGRILHEPVPVDWAGASRGPLERAARAAGLSPRPGRHLPGLVVRRLPLAEGSLLVVVNERAQDARVPFAPGGAPASSGDTLLVPAGRCRMAFLGDDHRPIDRSHPAP